VNEIDCVFTTDTLSASFKIVDGAPELVGIGDHHDDHFSEFGRSLVLNDFSDATPIVITLTVYPTEQIFSEYQTHAPRTVTVSIVAAISISAIFFLLYDFFMRGESRERRVILETKRRFVRFISHEVRKISFQQ